MNRFLLIDIGAGTMDILYYDPESDHHYKAVTKSPVLYMAEKIAGIPGNLFVGGYEMGGGMLSNVIKQRAREAEVVMTVSAAATIHHNLEKVRSWGIKIVADEQAGHFSRNNNYTALTISDLDIGRLENIVTGWGIPFKFDVVGICAQDHGIPPDGVSHLDYRHNIFKASLDQNPSPESLLYTQDRVPTTFNRLASIAKTSQMLPADEIYIMDSGMAAILGASLDLRAKPKKRMIVVDVATSHTVGAALDGNEIAGFFEYHTRDITLERLDKLIPALANGDIEHNRILKEGGHGAYLRNAFGFEAAEIIVVTGPKRGLVENSKLPLVFGAPFGDNMMTGTVGLLEAIRLQKKLNPISYF